MQGTVFTLNIKAVESLCKRKTAVPMECCECNAVSPLFFGPTSFCADMVKIITIGLAVNKINSFVNRAPIVDVIMAAENSLCASFFEDCIKHTAVEP